MASVLVALASIICAALVTNVNEQNAAIGVGIRQVEAADSLSSSAAGDEEVSFNLARIDENVVRQFRSAWRDAGLGTSPTESLVLVFRKLDGTYLAIRQKQTNEARKFTFRWRHNAIAVVHAYRNIDDPEPSKQDQWVADQFGVPIFTITSRGMFGYDPSIRKTNRIMDGLDWLEASKFVMRTEGQMLSNRIHITSK